MGYDNPLLNLPAGRRLRALPREQRRAIVAVLRELQASANELAEVAHKRRKGPMYSYWRAVATYSRHAAHVLNQKDICGKVNSGYICDMPAGSKCPDCGLALHDFPEDG